MPLQVLHFGNDHDDDGQLLLLVKHHVEIAPAQTLCLRFGPEISRNISHHACNFARWLIGVALEPPLLKATEFSVAFLGHQGFEGTLSHCSMVVIILYRMKGTMLPR